MTVNVEKVAKFDGRILCISANHDAPALKEQFKKFVEVLSKQKSDGIQIEVKILIKIFSINLLLI